MMGASDTSGQLGDETAWRRHDRVTAPTSRTTQIVRGLGIAVTLLALSLAHGVSGALLGTGIGVLVFVIPAPVTFALAHAGLFAFAPDGVPPVPLLLVEAGLLLALFAPLWDEARLVDGWVFSVPFVVFVGLVGLFQVSVRFVGPSAAYAVPAVVTVALLYVGHRYHLVRLGLVPER